MKAVSNLVHQSARSIHTVWTWTQPHMKHPGNKNPEHACREGKTLSWKAETLDDQTFPDKQPL